MHLSLTQVSLRCAELLNKWAASTPEYSPEIMVRSATYAKEASDIFAYMTDDASMSDYGTALYWMGLYSQKSFTKLNLFIGLC
jgi:hypothetical protein